MDDVLRFVDNHFFEPYEFYPAWLPANNAIRQFISIWLISVIGGTVLYLSTASLSYYFLFDHRLKQHKLFLKNQVRREITYTLLSLPIMSVFESICFLLQVRGHSRLLSSPKESRFGWWHIPLTMCTFIIFTDSTIYWIHRVLHCPVLYRTLHKAHHAWKVPTPFASHAFHPVDGFVQSLPYHLYVFLFPMYKWLFLGMFVFVNLWTVAIHDNEVFILHTRSRLLRWLINGAAHHTDHHLYYNYNYGQFFTLWDRFCGSFRLPSSFKHAGPKEQLGNPSVMGSALREHCAEKPSSSSMPLLLYGGATPAVGDVDAIRERSSVDVHGESSASSRAHTADVPSMPCSSSDKSFETVDFIDNNASKLD